MPAKKDRFPIGRIYVQGRAYFDAKKGGRHLYNTLKYHWPENATVDILITPGGFINSNEVDEYGKVNKKWNATPEDIEEFNEIATVHVNNMLKSGKIYQTAKGKVKFISIGCDICFNDDFRAELVCMVDVNKRKIVNWTGKSYPTDYYELRDLIQVADLDTHFKDVLGHRVMILGCHDLTMFNRRGHANQNVGSDKYKRCKDMAKKTKRYKPTLVIQHPHTVDSPRIWSGAWGGVKNDYPSVEAWASGVRYYNRGEEQRGNLKSVLKHTKSDDESVLDIKLVRERK